MVPDVVFFLHQMHLDYLSDLCPRLLIDFEDPQLLATWTFTSKAKMEVNLFEAMLLLVYTGMLFGIDLDNCKLLNMYINVQVHSSLSKEEEHKSNAKVAKISKKQVVKFMKQCKSFILSCFMKHDHEHNVMRIIPDKRVRICKLHKFICDLVSPLLLFLNAQGISN